MKASEKDGSWNLLNDFCGKTKKVLIAPVIINDLKFDFSFGSR